MREPLRWCSVGVALCTTAAMVTGSMASVGCSTATTMTDVWRDPSYVAGPIHNALVFGTKMNATNRRTLEDGFVGALALRGVSATASYKLFPGELPSADDARTAVMGAGFDGVIVATPRGSSTVTYYGTGAASPAFWGGYYGIGWADPGTIYVDQYVKFETSLWDPRGNGKIIWSAITQTENPTSGHDFVKSLTKNVMTGMTRSGFLPVPPEESKPISLIDPAMTPR